MGNVHTLHKLEKLSHKATLDAIFQKKGKSIFKTPVLLAYYKTDLRTPFPCQFFVSVGKRKFKHAVNRNRLRRQLTDIYRLQKHRIHQAIPQETKYAIGILFLGKTMPTHTALEKHLNAAIDEFIERVK
jgi:ribonuclease P protein component